MHQTNHSLLSVSFCCYKIGSREALDTCLNRIVPLISLEYRGKSKIEMAAALLAYNLGEFAVGKLINMYIVHNVNTCVNIKLERS